MLDGIEQGQHHSHRSDLTSGTVIYPFLSAWSAVNVANSPGSLLRSHMITLRTVMMISRG